jgi:hypothetical protein
MLLSEIATVRLGHLDPSDDVHVRFYPFCAILCVLSRFVLRNALMWYCTPLLYGCR